MPAPIGRRGNISGTSFHYGIAQHPNDAFAGNQHTTHTVWLTHFEVSLPDESLERTEANAKCLGGFLPRVHEVCLDRLFGDLRRHMKHPFHNIQHYNASFDGRQEIDRRNFDCQ